MTRKKKTVFLTFFAVIGLALISGLILLLKKPERSQNQELQFTKAPASSLYLYQLANRSHKVFLVSRQEKNYPEVKMEQGEAWITFSPSQKAQDFTKEERAVRYHNVWPQIDLSYRPLKNGLKEEIIINNFASLTGLFPNQEASFNFKVNLRQAVFKDFPLSNNTIFVDPQSNDYRFHFAKPFMVDAKGEKSEAVFLKLIPQENDGQDQKITTYLLQIIPSWEWLSRPERVYPVVIDPTIIDDSEEAFLAGSKNRVADEIAQDSLANYGIGYHEMPKDDHTVGLWHMENNWSDSSDFTNNGGAYNNPTFTGAAKIGSYAGNFNGTTDYIITTNDISLAPEKEFTLEAWVQPHDFSTDATWGDSIIQKDLNSTGYQLVWHQDGKFGCLLGNGSGATADFGTIKKNLFQWYHVACVYDGSNIKLYVNGILEKSTPRSYSRNVSDYVWFGSWYDGQRNFNGYIDEVRISNIARSEEEIRHNAGRNPYGVYTSEATDLGEGVFRFNSLSWNKLGVRTGDGEEPYSSTGLLAHWKFNETSGTTLNDSSGNGKNGTLTNFANTGGQDVSPASGWTSNNKRWGAGALMFDGTNDYVNLGTNAFGSLTIPFSIEGWIYLRGRPSSYVSIFHSDDQDDPSGNYYGAWLNMGPDNLLTVQFGNGTSAGAGGRRSYGGGKVEVPVGAWTHVAATVNGPNEMAVYVNGVEINGTYTGTATSMVHNSSYSARIGRNALYGPYYMNGAIDSLKIYSRALPASEVIANYQAGMIEFQTRTGATNNPEDGSWEAWRPTNSESQLLNLDADDANWSWDNNATYAPLVKGSDNGLKTEGTGSLNLALGSRSPQAGTVGLWHLEETSGTGAYLKDASLSNAHLTPSGATIAKGFSGKGRSFNGSSNYLYCADASCGGIGKLDVTGDLTIEAWINPNVLTGTQRVVSKWSSASSGTYFLTASESGNSIPRFLVTGATQAYRDASVAIPPKTWTHIAGVYKASARTLDIYINGELKNGTITGTVPTSLANSANDFYIGAQDSSHYFFNGKIDEVQVVAAALSQEAIAEAYRAGRDHRLTRTISTTDLSTKTKLSFDIASDRAGNFLEAIIGESNFANNEPDSNTVGFWRFADIGHIDEYLTDTNGYPTTQLFIGGWAATGCGDTSSNQPYFLDQYPSPGDSFGGKTWTTSTDTDGNFNLDAIICGGDCTNVYSYSHIYLYSPANQTIRLKWGSDDASQVWVNGSLASTQATCQGVAVDQFQVDVGVEEGWNEILWRIAEGSGGYGLAWRITNTANIPLRMIYRVAKPTVTKLADIRDESSSANHGLSAGVNITPGRFGLGRTFAGNSGSYVAIPDSSSLRISAYTVSVWVYANQQDNYWKGIIGKEGRNYTIFLGNANTDAAFVYHRFATTGGGWNDGCPNTGNVIKWGQWNHIVITNNGTTCKTYVNGKEEASGSVNGSLVVYNTTTYIGRPPETDNNLNARSFRGIIDEPRIDKVARSADEVRQLYEIEKRTHPIKIDFASSPGASDIKGTSETAAKSDTTLVLANDGMVNNIFPSETLIIKENYNGTEYTIQGRVSDVDTTNRAIAVASWEGTVPNAGTTICGGSDTYCFSANASVFKWQKEWFDLTAPLSSHLNGTAEISLRPVNGWEGHRFWFDDFRINQAYLTNSSGATVSSTPNRYFQYRAIFSTTDMDISPLLTMISLNYDALEAPSNCYVDDTQHPAQLIVHWQDNSSFETGYQIIRIRQDDLSENTFSVSANNTSYTDASIEANYSYQYKIRAQKDGFYSAWCYTPVLNLGVGGFRFENLKMEGIRAD